MPASRWQWVPRQVLRPKHLLLGAVWTFVFSLFWFQRSRWDPAFFRENGPIENFQAACVVAGWLLFGWGAWRAAGPGRILKAGLALFYLTVAILEIDLRKTEAPAWIIFSLNGVVRNLWVGALWLAAFFWFWSRARPVWSQFQVWLAGRSGAFFCVAAPFWVAAAIVEKSGWISPKDRGLMVEELLEVNGAFFLLLAACFALRLRNAAEPGDNGLT